MKELKFNFGKATEITSLVEEEYPVLFSDNTRYFVTPDSNDYHILRIVEGYGEDYEVVEGSFILEHNLISHGRSRLNRPPVNIDTVRLILDKDDGGNYDYIVRDSLDECVERIDGGYGINNLVV